MSDMKADEKVGIAERSPEAVLDFWLGGLRTAADASRRNWQQGMLRWRIGPFARSAEDPNILRAQREWCEQMHREGPDRFFRDPVWDTPKGLLAKLIVLDQFPRGVYRGTALAYANDSLTASLSWQACNAGQEFAHYNVIERFWLYLPLSHAEDLPFQEVSIEKFARWSADLIAEASPDRRRINQFVSWSMVRAAIEHSETLLLFDRFPHRNAVMQRPHRGGEARYLTDPMRPLWSFTQPPDPDYFALLGALRRTGDVPDDNRISREALARPASRGGDSAGGPGFADGRLRPRRRRRRALSGALPAPAPPRAGADVRPPAASAAGDRPHGRGQVPDPQGREPELAAPERKALDQSRNRCRGAERARARRRSVRNHRGQGFARERAVR